MNKRTEAVLEEIGRLATRGYFIGLHVRLTSPMFVFRTYDTEWVDHYTRRSYALRDPMIAWGLAFTGMTRWSASPIPDPFGIMKEAASFGLRYGMQVSCGPLLSRSIGGFARDDREFTDAEMEVLQNAMLELHELTKVTKRLTEAEVEALEKVGSGMRYAEAAGVIGISESALKMRLKGAQRKLMARTVAEAIQKHRDHRLV